MRKVFFYGSLPKEGESPYGGGEVGNMRTVKMLEAAGYSVFLIRKNGSKSSWGKIHTLSAYPFRMIEGLVKVFSSLLFANRKSVVHLSGFAGVTILNEYLIMQIIKLLRFPMVYELRGGGAVQFYDEGSFLYKKLFIALVRKADYVFTQGEENIPLLNRICKTPVYHYANCVEEGFAPSSCPSKPNDRINLLFYGRLEEDKHIDLVVDAAAIVQKEISNVFLTIVGNGKDSYIKYITEKMEKGLIAGSYSLQPGVLHDDLPALLLEQHFFFFPSTQIREGQSNSVTESMSFGIVPVASPQGFNRSTIGANELIVEQLDPQSYADVVLRIVRDKSYLKYSQAMYERYSEYFSQKQVFERTLKVYDTLFSTIETQRYE